MNHEIASQSVAVSRQGRTVVSITLAFRNPLVRRSFPDRAVVVESIAARLTIYFVALLFTNLALSGCGTAYGQAGKSFEIASIVSSVGGTPQAAVRTYTIVILNHLDHPVHIAWIEVPNSKASRATIWSVVSGGRRLLLAHSTGSRVAIDKPLNPSTNLEITGRIIIGAAGLSKRASLSAFPRDRVRISYIEGDRTKTAELRAQ